MDDTVTVVVMWPYATDIQTNKVLLQDQGKFFLHDYLNVSVFVDSVGD